MTHYHKKLTDLEIKGRKVFVRVDFNVPIKGAKSPSGETIYEVVDDTRIKGALATIKYVIDNGGKCILASHLGRPEGKPHPKYSLEPVGKVLSHLLNKEVWLSEDCVGDGPKALVQQMRPGDILLLENLRFHPGEEENSPEFAHRLLELCDVFVGDAFGTLHRAHASTSALPKMAPEKGVGFLVEKELKFLQPLKDSPKKPFALVMGGSKVSDKIGMIEHLLSKIDSVFIGGAMSYAFLKAMEIEVGKSLCEDKQVRVAERLLKAAEVRNIKIHLPVDHAVVTDIKDPSTLSVTPGVEIPLQKMGIDIGPRTLVSYETELQNAATIFWNGPMGVFEVPEYAKGTFGLARAIAKTKALKLVGGGDSASAVQLSGCEDQFDFISTGGGATLEYLEGKELPGLKALENQIRKTEVFPEDEGGTHEP